MTARRSPMPVVLVLVAAAVLITLFGPALADWSTQSRGAALRQADAVAPGEALPAYDRTLHYGRAWIDTDGNGCDTRNDILKRDLHAVVLAKDGCTVLRGTLVDPYTGVLVEHVAGPGLRSKVQIDHVYSLRDAHDDGAITELTFEERVRLANDPRNLIAALGTVNGAKGSLGPAQWTDKIITGTDAQCSYLVSYAVVALEYGLQPDPEHRGFLEADFGNRCDVPSLTTR